MLCVRQVTKYVEREILNHRFLMHPHIVQFKEVCTAHPIALCHANPASQAGTAMRFTASGGACAALTGE